MKNYNHLEKHLEKKIKRRERKKKSKPKVSGKNVLKLKKIIEEKRV